MMETMTKMDTAEWNPRYVLYARSKGREAAEQLVRDREDWPGGCMVGFQIFIANAKQLFLAKHPGHMIDGHIAGDKAEKAFDEFLSNLIGE